MPREGFDAIVLVSFGGPERPDDVMPFLERVTRGRGIPRDRLLAVAEHYHHFGGKSPINDECRRMQAAIGAELAAHGPSLPVYWGNRFADPMLADTLRRMRDDGVGRALAFVTSAFSSYSGCRAYREEIERARAEVGPGAPEIEKLRVFYDHPLYVEIVADRVGEALSGVPEAARSSARVVFTAHSIPIPMAKTSRYVAQLEASVALVAARAGVARPELAWQSRSGPPSQPWLEPDIGDWLAERSVEGARDVVVVPIGFVSDHMEIVWDLDTQAAERAREVGVRMVRAGTAGSHPKFASMIRELVRERTEGAPARALGPAELRADLCAPGCCPAPRRE